VRRTVKAAATHGEVGIQRVGVSQVQIDLGSTEMQLLSEHEVLDLIELLTRTRLEFQRERMQKEGL
jgi:hypothetical protein